MIRLLAVCHHQRTLHVVADAAYHGKALRKLRGNVIVTTRLPANAVLYDLAPPRTGRRGRTDAVYLAEISCLWYGSFHTRTVRVILLRDASTESGYDLALVTTDLHSSPAALIGRYAWRWSIEVTFAEARDLLGVGQARNRTENAIRRTVPFSLYCYTITVIWYTLHGHHPNDAAERRHRAPWYTTKTEPAFSDMLAKLRRVIVTARFFPITAGRPTDDDIRTVQQAWASASLDPVA
ncbi:transposase [Catenulispora sp. GAS73]|uniref:transposase n=1 Tax=Catenulispora sp. GAS73 TaxID=3156269 RepID=UPI003514B912